MAPKSKRKPIFLAEVERDVDISRKFLTVGEAAIYTRHSEVSIRRWLTEGKLRRFRCGLRTLVLLSELDALVREVD